jgi:hypothetical protein
MCSCNSDDNNIYIYVGSFKYIYTWNGNWTLAVECSLMWLVEEGDFCVYISESCYNFEINNSFIDLTSI